MNLREHIDQQLAIRPEPHHADLVLLNTAVGDIDTTALKTDASRMVRLIQTANEIHGKSLMASCLMGGNVTVPEAVVSPHVIGGEAAGRQGGQRAALGLMRFLAEGGVAIGPINAVEDPMAPMTGRILSTGRAAILSI